MKKSDFFKRNNLFSASCAGECLKWCTSQDYTYYPNYPISYLWAYGNMSRAFVVESNMMCEGYNPSNGKYSKILLVMKKTQKTVNPRLQQTTFINILNIFSLLFRENKT